MESLPFDKQSVAELLEQVLGNGSNCLSIAETFSISQIISASRHELGLTPQRYSRLMAGIELGRRVHEAKTQYSVPDKITGSAQAIDFCRNHFHRLIHDSLQEEFHIVTLNTKNSVISTHRVTLGTLDASLVHPREVFRPAIRDSASSILLAHNHPSGDPEPSREDIVVTNRLEEAGRVIGINVLDHIVLAKQGCVSIKEKSL